TCSSVPMPPSGQPRHSRHAAPSTARAASASAARSSTVPLLPSSPRVRSHRPTTCPEATCFAIVPPRPISRSSGCGPKTRRSTLSLVTVLLYCTFPVRRTRTTILDIHARPPERHSQGADQGKTGGEGQASREAPVAARRAVPCGRAGRRPLSALRLLLGNVLAGARRAVLGRTGDGT